MRSEKSFFLIFAQLLIAILLAGCAPGIQKAPKPSADWSRGISLGENVVGSTGLSIDESGQGVHIVWPFEDEEATRIRYAHIDGQGNITASRDLGVTGQIRAPRVVMAGNGKLHLVWSRRQPPQTHWELWHLIIDQNGSAAGEARRISPEDIPVGKISLSTDHAGGAIIFYESGSSGELQLIHLDSDGHLKLGPIDLPIQGDSPDATIDPAGNLHLVWHYDRGFYYARTPTTDISIDGGVLVADLKSGGALGTTGDTFAGPEIGYANYWAYVLWSVLSQSDTEAGSAIAEYVAFPINQPIPHNPNRIWMIAAEEQPYTAYRGELNLSQLVQPLSAEEAVDKFGIEQQMLSKSHGDWLNSFGGITDFIMNPNASSSPMKEMPAAFSVSQQQRWDISLEIAIGLFEDGIFQGYSLATKTGSLSDYPTIAVDQQNNIHIVWREGAGGRNIYYATSNPMAMSNLDRFNVSDLYNTGLRAIMDSFTSLAFLPIIGFWWILPGFLLLVGWRFFKEYEYVNQPAALLPLSISLVLYQVFKFMSLPTILSYVPFSAWVPVLPPLNTLLRIAVPIGIFLIALYIANIVRRRKDSAILFFLITVLVDSFLTLAIYGVNLLGAF